MKAKFILAGMIILVAAVALGGYFNQRGSDGSDDAVYLIKGEQALPADLCSEELASSILYIGTKFCVHCKAVLPVFREVENETNATFKYLDISESADAAAAREYGLWPQYTPTVIIGCRAYIGEKDKAFYEDKVNALRAQNGTDS